MGKGCVSPSFSINLFLAITKFSLVQLGNEPVLILKRSLLAELAGALLNGSDSREFQFGLVVQ